MRSVSVESGSSLNPCDDLCWCSSSITGNWMSRKCTALTGPLMPSSSKASNLIEDGVRSLSSMLGSSAALAFNCDGGGSVNCSLLKKLLLHWTAARVWSRPFPFSSYLREFPRRPICEHHRLGRWQACLRQPLLLSPSLFPKERLCATLLHSKLVRQ